MSKVSNEALIDVVQVYNDEGRTAAYDLLRNQYGVKNPYFTTRISSNGVCRPQKYSIPRFFSVTTFSHSLRFSGV